MQRIILDVQLAILPTGDEDVQLLNVLDRMIQNLKDDPVWLTDSNDDLQVIGMWHG